MTVQMEIPGKGNQMEKRGSFSDQPDMARIFFLTPEVEVYIRTDDGGNFPHFHVREWGNGKVVREVCIRFDKAAYDDPRGKTLPNGLAEMLDDRLRRQNPHRIRPETYWETAIHAWNDNHSGLLDDDLKQPDYRKLNGGNR